MLAGITPWSWAISIANNRYLEEQKMKKGLIFTLVFLMTPAVVSAETVGITKDVFSITVLTPEGRVEVKRNQDVENTIKPAFARTSRKCPPFCIQPHQVAPGVQTIGELEMINFMAEKKGIVIDARTISWHARGTIPGSKSIPFTEIARRLNELGCKKDGEKWDCSEAKDVSLFCNGPWCGQSPTAIRSMIGEGYPVSKIRYYRNGMQGWESVGLTVVEGSL
jgi:rhodanese-related sulfurtransferase